METRIPNPAIDLVALVNRLRQALPSVVPEFGKGRDRIRDEVARELGLSEQDADGVISDLTERGLLHYNDDGRAPGVPGHWELRPPTTT
jgi:hypothetical protein